MVLDKPRAAIFVATPAKVGVQAKLEAVVTQSFGHITLYKWDDGKAPGWDDSSSSSVDSFTYQAKGGYPVRLYVRDDDGNTDSVQYLLDVGNDDPLVHSGLRDTTITIKDTVTFKVSATDPEGIKYYLWDFNGDGKVDDTTAAPSNSHVFPATPLSQNVLLTVIDNFGGRTEVQAKVTVVLDAPDAILGKDTTVSIKHTVHIRGSAADGRGHIVKLEWSIDGSEWIKASKPETTFVVPSA